MIRFLFAFLPLTALAQTPTQVRQYLDAWDLAQALPAARALPNSPELLGEALSLAGDPTALAILDAALERQPSALLYLRRADERSQRRQWAAALEDYQRALADLPAPAHLGIGIANTNLGRYPAAKAALEQAGSSCAALRALSTLAYLQSDLPLAEKHLASCQALPTTNPIEQAQTQLLAAGLAMERGRYEEALVGLGQSLQFYEARLGPQNRRLLPILRNIARGERFRGQLPAVIRTSERALAISIQTFGEKSTSTAELLGILAAAQAESGLLSEARQLYDRVLAVQTELLGSNHSQVGFELFSLANLEQVMGDFESSLRHANQSLQIREAVDGKESPRTVTIYSLLGRVNALNGNVRKGRELTELAVAIGRRTVGEAHPRTIFARSDLGEVLYLAKDYAAALPHFVASLAGQTKLFGADNIRIAQGEYNLGLAERALGHHPEALLHFANAHQIWRRAFGPDYLLLTETNAGQAASLAALHRPAEALAPALESARVRRASLAAVAITAAEREALLFARVDRDGLLLAIDLLATTKPDPTTITQVWDAVIRDRAAVLDAMARRRSANQNPADSPIARLKKELAQAVLIGDSKLYLSRVTTLRQQLDDAERSLARQSAGFARQADRTRAGWAEVRAALPAGSALVGYTRGETQYIAFVARPGVPKPRAYPLGPTARLDPLVKAWQQEIERERNSAGRNARRNEDAYRQAALALRRAIWDPLAPALSGARTIYTVLDGALQLVNFDTLPTGTQQYLAEVGPLFQTLTAERDLVAPPPTASPRPGRLLALGNPTFTTRPAACADLDRRNFPALPGSAAEALAIANLWKAQGRPAQVLQGSAASESALKAQAAGQQVLHLATHGFFLTTTCQRDRETALNENPLLRSGLILTAGGPSQEDGLLTAEEVSALRLETTELVVLSGCDTARGAAEAGEGLLGLRRAFQAAGVRQVVSSLWPVEDAATRQWMLRFYQARLPNGASVARAVRTASAAALRDRRTAAQSTHPFYWGGFVASGF